MVSISPQKWSPIETFSGLPISSQPWHYTCKYVTIFFFRSIQLIGYKGFNQRSSPALLEGKIKKKLFPENMYTFAILSQAYFLIFSGYHLMLQVIRGIGLFLIRLNYFSMPLYFSPLVHYFTLDTVLLQIIFQD